MLMRCWLSSILHVIYILMGRKLYIWYFLGIGTVNFLDSSVVRIFEVNTCKEWLAKLVYAFVTHIRVVIMEIICFYTVNTMKQLATNSIWPAKWRGTRLYNIKPFLSKDWVISLNLHCKMWFISVILLNWAFVHDIGRDNYDQGIHLKWMFSYCDCVNRW